MGAPFSKAALPLSHPACLLATWFGSGLLRPAPGTWGSLAALPFAWIITYYGGPIALAAATVLIFALGCWASDVYERAGGDKDPGVVVIDEVAGQWLVLIAAPLDPWYYLAAFVLFRICDILKPWPAGWADRKLSGGLGIMMDDILAALYAVAAIAAFRVWY
ncbi:MAG: phosphatidylglycerophosphatase A [Alphaproteobacteria bacterium]|jgi:phosphatidylglycerophosphatase A|nr:phosphatidylglycerophosphatase A [Alphaproteobacteria bacterium]MDP6832346.1 phosphatidylglycerophosphatase A [Alphaproteobacteria bacterium]MDP6875713.1 phosphatidylglycerophosphatase A [Alphaproteobacteria bacterium]